MTGAWTNFTRIIDVHVYLWNNAIADFQQIIQGTCTFRKVIKFTGLLPNYPVLQMQYFKFRMSKIP